METGAGRTRAARGASGRAASELADRVATAATDLVQGAVDRGLCSPRSVPGLFRKALVLAYRLAYLRELDAALARDGLAPLRAAARAALERPARGEALRRALGSTVSLEPPGGEPPGRPVRARPGARPRGAAAPAAPSPFPPASLGVEPGAEAWGRLVLALAGETVRDPGRRAVTAEAFGRSYEPLVALEAVLAERPMVRVRREGIESLVTPEAARRLAAAPTGSGARAVGQVEPGRVVLLAGTAQKGAGAYYTPGPLRRFLVDRTLSPLLAPEPAAVLRLRVLDPAMGAGHFLLEAARLLGSALGRGAGGHAGLAAATRSCLRGIDRDPVAVEVARLVLALETRGEASPAELSAHLVAGDALTGPFLDRLSELPVAAARVPEPLARWLEAVRPARPDSAVGRTLAVLARAWTGAVVEGGPRADRAYLGLLAAAAAGEEPAARPEASRLLALGGDGVALDLAFSEVFAGEDGRAGSGFDAVVGNPPWDKVVPLERELFARFDPSVLDSPTARERAPACARLRLRPEVRAAWKAYELPFRRTNAIGARIYELQRVGKRRARAERVGGHGDLYRYFVERSWACLARDGRLGLVLPAAVYANKGSAGVRRLLLDRSRLELCVGFDNRRRLFEVASGQRFALVVASRGGSTDAFEVAFGLEDPAELEGAYRGRLVELDRAFVDRIAPGLLCLPAVGSASELRAARTIFGAGRPWGETARELGVDLAQELNMTTDSPLFATSAEVLGRAGLPDRTDARAEPARSALLGSGWLVVAEKGTFHAFDDRLKGCPRYLCAAEALRRPGPRAGARARALEASRWFRLAVRATIHASEADKLVVCMLPPGVVVGNSALAESAPSGRPSSAALALMAAASSAAVGFAARLRVVTNLNKFLLEQIPLPDLEEPALRLLCHAAVRLSCGHAAYAPLWAEQLGGSWREPGPAHRWPAVAEPAERLKIRAAVDAVVAAALGLAPELYGEVLGAAVVGRGAEARRARLDALDELARLGLEAFSARHDPYAEIPLVTALPAPDPGVPTAPSR